MQILRVCGGLFGLATALGLDRDGHEVTLYERATALMEGGLRRQPVPPPPGLSLTRSPAMARECRKNRLRFRETVPDAVLSEAAHYYCIASEGSKTGPEEFLGHCDALDLPYERAAHPTVRDDRVAHTFRVPEARADLVARRAACLERLRDSDVHVHRDRHARPADFAAFDRVVLATDARLNELLPEDSALRRRFKCELCEKPLVALPPASIARGR